MKREEASARIKYLRDQYRRQITEYQKQREFIPVDATIPYIWALDVALAALRGPTREMVERMRGCSDCQRKTCVSCRRFGWVPQRCVDCSDQDKWSPWNFCPVCGKPLTDEAVDMVLERVKEVISE